MKNKKQETKPEKPLNKFQTFRKYYKEVPGVKALVKLGFYFIFFAVFLSVVAFGKVPEDSTNSESTNNELETTTEEVKVYKDMLEEILVDNNDIKYEISTDSNRYIIDYTINNNTFSGLVEREDGLTKFKFNDGKYYELKLNEEVENTDLFADINLEYLNIYSLVNLLSSSKSLKTLNDDTTIYNYNLDNVAISVTATNTSISKINISEGNNTYSVTLEVSGA